jgi:hypothetical protein
VLSSLAKQSASRLSRVDQHQFDGCLISHQGRIEVDLTFIIAPMAAPGSALRTAGARAYRPLATWAVALARLFLFVQAALAGVVVVVKLLLYFGSEIGRSPDEMQGLTDIVTVAINLAVGAWAIALIAGARQLSRKRLQPLVVLGVAFGELAGVAVTVLDMRPSLDMMVFSYSVPSFQLWSAWPLVLWPAIVVVVTLVLGATSERRSRVIGVAWIIACVLLSAFAVSYLLPAEDPTVAGLHGLGVVRMPTDAGWILDASGRIVQTRDADPMIYIDQGKGGEVTTVLIGAYRVREFCTDQNGRTTESTVAIDVRLGSPTVVPDRCPST